MYTLHTDKPTVFEAQLQIQGTSTDKSIARLVLESNDWNLVFNGTIDGNGKVKIPIKKLKQIFTEGQTGAIKLEVIADDTYFVPWTTDFQITTERKVEAMVVSTPILEDKKSVKVVMTTATTGKGDITGYTHPIPLNQLVNQLKNEGINIFNIRNNKKKLNKIVESFVKKHKISKNSMNWIIQNTIKKLLSNGEQ